LDAALKLDQGSALTYPEYVIKQKQQTAETEQLERTSFSAHRNLRVYYDTKCHGQRFQVRDRIWYRNRAKAGRKKFLNLGVAPGRL